MSSTLEKPVLDFLSLFSESSKPSEPRKPSKQIKNATEKGMTSSNEQRVKEFLSSRNL